METDKLFEGLELKDELKTELSGRITKTLQEVESSYTKTIEESKSKLDEAIATRQKAKDRVKELEEKITKGDIDGLKEAKALAEKYKADYETSTAQIEELQTNYKSKADELTKYVDSAKSKILEKIPDNLKEPAKKMGLEDLNAFYDGLVKEKVITDKSIHPNNNNHKKEFKSSAEWVKYYNNK